MTTNTVPRRIEGHEIKPGQVIANHFEEDGSGCRGVVVRVLEDKAMVAESHNETDFDLSPVFFDSTITLLEEAPRIGEAIDRKDILPGDKIAVYGYRAFEDGSTFTVEGTGGDFIDMGESGPTFRVSHPTRGSELRLVERKPERRGEVIKPADVRTGDVLDLYMEFGRDLIGVVAQPREENRDSGWHRGLRNGDGSTTGSIIRATGGWHEIRLVERPELPTAKGSVIAVHAFADEWFSEPAFAMADRMGDWFRVDGDLWPDRSIFTFDGHNITDWSPAQVEYTIGEAA